LSQPAQPRRGLLCFYCVDVPNWLTSDFRGQHNRPNPTFQGNLTYQQTLPKGPRWDLTHDLGSCGCSNDDGQVGCNEGHPGLHILIDAVFGGIQLQCHVTGLL
ncbi:mCG146283, partial [Mus musculus]